MFFIDKKKDFSDRVPYYPYSLYFLPLILAIVIGLFYLLFKNITMGRLQNISEQLKNIEYKLLKKEKEVKEEKEQ